MHVSFTTPLNRYNERLLLLLGWNKDVKYQVLGVCR